MKIAAEFPALDCA